MDETSEFNHSYPRLSLGFPEPGASASVAGSLKVWCARGEVIEQLSIAIFTPEPYLYGTFTCEYALWWGEGHVQDHALGSQSFTALLNAFAEVRARLLRWEAEGATFSYARDEARREREGVRVDELMSLERLGG